MSQLKEVEKLNYEQAYEELQSIVSLLDEGGQPLDKNLKLFERGQALAKHCENLLTQAQLKIRETTGDSKEVSIDA
ncbi:MAG: exodeoxyribonuclease VII small subunit [Anaerolineaceae bacterium]|nr:exodeoxyribonuclease VII small subunit [Anaerolineaceae bacterium]MBN2677112.1 exodeoxyribonuclease VII small subunit [Anaerolineaceae bacterium]